MKGASAAPSSEAAALALLAAANVMLPRLSRRTFAPASLGTAAALTWLARRSGATWRDLGMDPADVPRGVVWGAAVGAPAAASAWLVASTPRARAIVVDEQAATTGRLDLAYHLLLRIPFGTALPEEVVFRGALPAILARGGRRGDLRSAALFGLWHVVDALEQLRTHPRRGDVSSPARSAAVVGTTVVVTTLAGFVFSALRRRVGSILAPAIVHAAVNSAGLLAGVAAARRAER